MRAMTYAYAFLDVSPATYAEIRAKLVAAGYAQALHYHVDDGQEVLDMHGIALVAQPEEPPPPPVGPTPEGLAALSAMGRSVVEGGWA